MGRIEGTIRDGLKEAGITGRVESRVKRLYSIHNKLVRQRITADQVYDLYAMRVITNSVQDCYAVLGIIHNLWRPVPGRIKDFIAMPRPNLYQSLHTSVITETGETFEVQIRTEEMHKMCEEGIAAHWKYKDGPVSAQDEQRLAWLRQVVEWQRDVSDPNEFLSTLKVDLYPEEVYTFTPKGKVVVLPRESTPIDFAYSVHTEVGHACTGAKVNGRMVPLRHKLHSGDIVEILTQPGHKPSRDWLAIVKSSRARNKIKHWLNVHQRERAIEIGRKLIEKEARKYRISLKEIKDPDLQRVASDYGLGRADDLMAGIGYGKFAARQVLAKLAPAGAEPIDDGDEQAPAPGISSVVRRVFGGDSNAIFVKGQDDLLVYRARCCNPIRGEAIVGYVTRGKGIAVHSINCPNVTNLLYEPERRIDVLWAGDKEGQPVSYPGQTHTHVRRPFRHAQADHCRHQRHANQYPRYLHPARKRPRHRGCSPRHCRPEAPAENHRRRAPDSRRVRRAAAAEDLANRTRVVIASALRGRSDCKTLVDSCQRRRIVGRRTSCLLVLATVRAQLPARHRRLSHRRKSPDSRHLPACFGCLP